VPPIHRFHALASLVVALAACGSSPGAPPPTLDPDFAPGESEQETEPGRAPGAVPLDEAKTRQLADAWAVRPEGYVPRTRHVASDGNPLYTNRLFLETSPYLRQHAHNPVNWYPWGPEAFEAAARLGRPILLSVGYSTCHWCHVMEEESFEDPEIAQYLNENYITIKVDREERPDVDAVYMAAVQALSGRGGWPMTVWMTPGGKPYYGGTYFPARDGDRGTRMGFLTMSKRLKTAFDEQPDEITKHSDDLAATIQAHMAPDMGGDLPTTADLTRVARQHLSRYDEDWGGRLGAPKFPSSLPLRFLLHEHQRTGDPELLSAVTLTLQKMAQGGMYDQIGGGFHRYSTDREWVVPHFEKMLYDNALLAVIYTEAWQRTGDPALAAVVKDIFQYMDRDMTAPEGAFYSATDADSPIPGTDESEEGWFFTWTPDEVRTLLKRHQAEAVLAWYTVTDRGNVDGRSILHTPRSRDVVAAELGISTDRLGKRITAARDTMLRHRQTRPPPLRDDKILAGWNGLMISAYARAARAFSEPAYAESAGNAADFVLSKMQVDGRLRRSYLQGQAKNSAMIEDYAFLIAGLIDLFEATGETRWLTEAIALDRVVSAHYEDAETGAWYRSADDAEVLLARQIPDRDGAEPSGASVHALNLLRLAELTTDDAFRKRADKALEAYSAQSRQGAMSEMLLAVQWRRDQPKEIVIVTPTSRAEAAPFLQELTRHAPANHVLVVVPEAGVAAMAAVVPLATGKVSLGGVPTAYVCEQGLCQSPTTDPAEFRAQLHPQSP
jgi:uncharacterized protein